MVQVTRDPASVYAEHAAELVRYATVLAGPSGADDLVADACVKAFASTAWDTVDNPRAYLYRAVLNQARQAARSGARRLARERRAAVTDHVDPPSPSADVFTALRGLTERQRAIVFFTYWQDRSTAEIADDLGLDQRTVQRELLAARTRLAEVLR